MVIASSWKRRCCWFQKVDLFAWSKQSICHSVGLLHSMGTHGEDACDQSGKGRDDLFFTGDNRAVIHIPSTAYKCRFARCAWIRQTYY